MYGHPNTSVDFKMSISNYQMSIEPIPQDIFPKEIPIQISILPPLRLKLEIQILAPQIIRVHIYFTLLHSPLSLSLSPPLQKPLSKFFFPLLQILHHMAQDSRHLIQKESYSYLPPVGVKPHSRELQVQTASGSNDVP